jgi:hypothetical protein
MNVGELRTIDVFEVFTGAVVSAVEREGGGLSCQIALTTLVAVWAGLATGLSSLGSSMLLGSNVLHARSISTKRVSCSCR